MDRWLDNIPKTPELAQIETRIIQKTNELNAYQSTHAALFICGEEANEIRRKKEELVHLRRERERIIDRSASTYFTQLFSSVHEAETCISECPPTTGIVDSVAGSVATTNTICQHETTVVDQKTRDTICMHCGIVVDQERISLTKDGCTYGNVPEIVYVGVYKPPSHFQDTMNDYQPKHTISIPVFIINDIRKMCCRLSIETTALNGEVIKFVLNRLEKIRKQHHKTKNTAKIYEYFEDAEVRLRRKPEFSMPRISYTNYYKHASKIANIISQRTPPCITPMNEERILAAFVRVVKAYKKSPRYIRRQCDRDKRKKNTPNNMNYNYIFYKLCQLLGFDEFLPFIPLPKSNAIIDDNDLNGWKYVCAFNKWRFIKTR